MGRVAAFDKALAPAITDLGRWGTHSQQTQAITLHNSLPGAMEHNRTQAFLRLLGREGGTVGPVIQYLSTTVVTSDKAMLAATGGRYLATAGQPEAMSPGAWRSSGFPKTRLTACGGTSPSWPAWPGQPCRQLPRRTSRPPRAS